ncbi:anti-FecI sigma factor, FecR [Pseudopedobacter saltans DSM 12145]|uniref:Anti-FecI sigma factor, FecR n=1 Tax=Pseudopedobacter saltans (strain ATCC 51119 / DSM 12145 / JCM 21818 / CCUG 39354 / LMG 10337 / NBRC 100064 / NCIMB 13643) TaxID=762903 RepID=F0S5D4_PSESL|nr:FecR family protein [Pseudopedobacter saltans]ADY52079.1 anti-FecI sigma factor, FecR [Pseudopedobacter saltans DSM 12145]
MEEKFYKELVDRYLKKKLNEDELQVFFHLLNEGKLETYLMESMDDDLHDNSVEEEPSLPKYRYLKYIYRIAAVLAIIGLAFSFYFYSYKESVDNEIALNELSQPVVPGGNNAVLTLSNGRQIILNEVANGTLEQNGNFSVEKQKDGLLVFNTQNLVSKEKNTGVNKIETPRGGIYQVILPDGSHVWLNSASSITFPARFAKNERKVSIKGEAYFEVSHNKKQPFKVLSDNQEIMVLGTKFNVNAYKDELITRTTLLEGSVKVSTAEISQLLKPGYQAQMRDTKHLDITPADLESVMAWKDGFFQFDRVDIQTLMRQLSRWYDIEVQYKGEIPKDEFVGKIKRSADIDNVLEVLRYGNVKFQLIGRKLIIG